MRILLICLFILGIVVGVAFVNFYNNVTEIMEIEQQKTHNALLNLNYEIIAHEQDVGLLKKENATLRLECLPK